MLSAITPEDVASITFTLETIDSFEYLGGSMKPSISRGANEIESSLRQDARFLDRSMESQRDLSPILPSGCGIHAII